MHTSSAIPRDHDYYCIWCKHVLLSFNLCNQFVHNPTHVDSMCDFTLFTLSHSVKIASKNTLCASVPHM